MCIGKGLTGGYMTMAAVLASRRVADAVAAGEAGVMMHGPTFMANPLACAVALESLTLLEEQDMAAVTANIESRLKRLLAPAATLPGVADVRVLGTIGVIEMKQPVDVGAFQRECVARGIWVRPFGKNVYVMPPYIITDKDLETLVNATIDIVRHLPQ